MKMDTSLLEAMNKQINHEFFSAYLYFAMSTYFIETNMEGFAKLTKRQAKEELDHAQKIYNYLIERDEKITLEQIEAPDSNWINPIDAIKNAYEHEKFVTEKIHSLYKKAKDTNDYATEVFLQWFITEQVEEEDQFRTMLQKMQMVQECGCEIVHIDREMNFANECVE